jgi:uncharacterized protein (TIRG00374 family)
MDRGVHIGPSRRSLIWLLITAAAALALLYVVLPAVAGLDETWQRLARGDAAWLAAAAALEVASYFSYVLMLRAVVAPVGVRLDLSLSYEITLAGVAATRILPAGGAGGIALTAWALRRVGLSAPAVATRIATMLVLLDGVYLLATVCAGLALWTGLAPGPAPFALTALPAALALVVIVLALGAAAFPGDLERRLTDARVRMRSRLHRWLTAALATASDGVRGALALVRARDPAVLAAAGWWAFDVAVLWACFEAYGDPPAVAVIVVGYFVGVAANLAPAPGGVGSVDGGLIATFVAFGVEPGLAIVAVLTYRAFAFWLPTLPGALAYVQLRRRFGGQA